MPLYDATSTLLIRKLAIWLLFGLVTGSLALHAVDGDRDARMAMLEHDHARLQTLNQRLARDNDSLRDELRGLETGAQQWQALAREEHGMVLSGEVVFHFPPRR